MAEKISSITLDQLLADGWVKTDDKVFPLEKSIENTNPINDDDDDTGIKLVLHSMYNSQNFAVLFPDGGLLNFNVGSMKALKQFENAIVFYDCPY
jgi:hypothetical protein